MAIDPNDAPEPARAANAAADPLAHPNAQAALRMARMGLPVFPCRGDKRPALNGWQAASTADPAAVADLWRRFPGAPPGVDCAKAGLIVIDCDRHGQADGVAAFNELVDGEIFPVTVQTPRNGMHIYFRRPDGFAPSNSTGDLPDGIDVRGNGYVISDGAVLPDGGCYTSEGFNAAKIGPLPDVILERLQRSKADAPVAATAGANVTPFPRRGLAIGDGWDHIESTPIGNRERAYAEEALKGCAADLKGAANGTRNASLNAVAYRMGRMVGAGWIGSGQVIGALTAAAKACGLTQDDGERQVHATLNSGLSKGIANPHPPLLDRPQSNAHDQTSKPGTRPNARHWDFDTPQDHTVAKRWIMKGILARGETSAWIAPPKAGKSALLADVCIAVAAGRDWRGKRSKERCAVVYFALERADLVRRRLIATMRRDGIGALPIRVIAGIPDLTTPEGRAAIISEINARSAHFGTPAGLIVFDTYPKLIAAGGGDEDKARDQVALLANLEMVKLETDCHAALIGHTGKDQGNGARGSNALLGDVDVMVRIKGDDHRTAIIEHANDAPEGVLTTFTMEGFELGRDEDGDPIDIGIVARDAPAQADAQEAGLAQRKLSPSQRIAFEALCEAINEAGEPQPGNPRIPAGHRAVNEDLWRRYAYKRGISDGDADAQRMAFKRAREALVANHRVACWDGLYWVHDDHA